MYLQPAEGDPLDQQLFQGARCGTREFRFERREFAVDGFLRERAVPDRLHEIDLGHGCQVTGRVPARGGFVEDRSDGGEGPLIALLCPGEQLSGQLALRGV